MKVKEYFLSEDYEPIRKIRSNPSVVKNGDRTTMGKRLRSSTGDLDRVNDLADSPRGVGSSPSKDSVKTPTPHPKLTTRQSVRDAIKMRELLPRHILNDLNHED